jgi:hypothetical protein
MKEELREEIAFRSEKRENRRCKMIKSGVGWKRKVANKRKQIELKNCAHKTCNLLKFVKTNWEKRFARFFNV